MLRLASLGVASPIDLSEGGGETMGGKNFCQLLQPPFYKRIARSGEGVVVVVRTDS